MHSIDQEQPEENRESLQGAGAIERIREMAEDAETCFFCTAMSLGESFGARPMGVLKVDDRGHLWFMSPSDSDKNKEIEANPEVRLFFQASKRSGFLSLSGRATISRDKALIDELWSPIFKTWFTEGKDDPRVTVVEVAPATGYYWDNKHGSMVAGTKMLVGAIIGKTLDDSVQGTLSP